MNIALVGMSRSGKDTVANLIRDYLEVNKHGHTRLLSFGDELKARFHDAFPEIPEHPKPREGYEGFGQLGRDLSEDIWVNALSLEMSGWKGLYDNFVITDLRQPNEERWARKNDFIFISVWSPGNIRRQRSKSDTNFVSVNKSEERLHEIDCEYYIHNIYDLAYLEERVGEIMKDVLDKEVLSIEKPTH